MPLQPINWLNILKALGGAPGILSDGNTVVIKDRQQATELQESWLITFALFLESKGVDATKVLFRLPSGRTAKVFKTSDGTYNWEITSE